MAKVTKIIVTGVKEIDDKLRQVEPKVARKIIRSSMRNSLRPIQQLAKQLAPKKTGALRKGIKIRAGKRKVGAIQINVYLGRATLPFTGDYFYGSLQEYGYHIGKRTVGQKKGKADPKLDKRKAVPGREFLKTAFQRLGAYAKVTAEQDILKYTMEAIEGK